MQEDGDTEEIITLQTYSSFVTKFSMSALLTLKTRISHLQNWRLSKDATLQDVNHFALVQLMQIQMRIPEYGWTTRKVFHLMNFVVNGCTLDNFVADSASIASSF